MRKPIKKAPARKRKGYDSGGWVDPTGDQLADTHNRTKAAQGGMTHEQNERYIAARGAMVSAQANERGSSTAAGDDKLWGTRGRTVELGRADYPGFKKGGKVKKVIRKR
jgi:hypothetical protein